MPDFDVADRLLPLHELGHGGREMLALLRGHGFHRGLPKCLLRRVAKQLLHLRGGVRNAPRANALDEPIPHALDDGAEALLALAKQLLRLPVLGNVLLNTVPEHTAVGGGPGGGDEAAPAHLARGEADPDLNLQLLSFREGP
jgi:hypothetical protein